MKVSLFIISIAISGFISRVAPLFDHEGRLLRQFVTEDGYLMLTIARNIALGDGMSTAAGTILTNGVQPLATYLFAACFWLADGDKTTGVALALAVSTLIAALTAWLIYRLGKRLLSTYPEGSVIAACAAALWFASPLAVKHSMNCLETGLYFTMALTVLLTFLKWTPAPTTDWSLKQCALMGLLLGVLFWTRNDAVFFILAVCITRTGLGFGKGWPTLKRRLIETILFGAFSVVVAIPWLVYNHRLFGSIVPVSGIAESVGASFGQNVAMLPAKLVEYLLLLPIPRTLETPAVLVIVYTLIVLAFLGAAFIFFIRGDHRVRIAIGIVFGFGLCLCLYYGFFFRAPHFLSRYLSPLSPFLALFSVTLLFILLNKIPYRRAIPLRVAVSVVALLLLSALNLRLYLDGIKHGHFQVVDWVQQHVANDVWVGAIQTGTLGFFHDRTLNLDGKVNPHALNAKLEYGSVLPYVIDSNIRYLIDWIGIIDWSKDTKYGFGEQFEVIVEDTENNLGVLRRY